MFDVDYFKRINDSYGHDIGDQVLQKIAELARKEMRRADVLARFGGEEFVALLPETTLEDAIMIAGRLRKISSLTLSVLEMISKLVSPFRLVCQN
jgi:diguanylate cyclase (GGDEF)-like protein